MTIYLDANATCVASDAVVDALTKAMGELWGNPSSPHHEGARAKVAIERSTAAVCRAFGAPYDDPESFVWTSGATEANNLAILGTARANPRRRHVVVAGIEHASVLGPAAELERMGYEVVRLPAGEDGRVTPESIRAAVRGDTLLVALMLANNETGVVQPAREAADIAHEVDALYLCDAAQCLGRLPVNIAATGADLVTMSAHKFGGPVGIGGLWVAPGTPIEGILFGGGQQGGLRPGTMNVAGAVAMGVAAAFASERAAKGTPEQMEAMRDRLERGILAAIPGTVVNGSGRRLPNTSNISFPGLSGAAIVQELAQRGVAASTAAVCGGTGEPSHVLTAMGLPERRTRGAVRLSLHRRIKGPDIDQVIEILADIVGRLQTTRTVPLDSAE